jgi:hypothetical protein
MRVNPISRVIVAVIASLLLAPLAAAADNAPADTDAAVRARLARKLPGVSFNGVGFSDTIDLLRDITGAKIVVDWAALQKAGVKKDQKLNFEVKDATFAEVLTGIFDRVTPEKPGSIVYTVKDGAVHIGPK